MDKLITLTAGMILGGSIVYVGLSDIIRQQDNRIEDKGIVIYMLDTQVALLEKKLKTLSYEAYKDSSAYRMDVCERQILISAR
jgi:hypothetical protein